MVMIKVFIALSISLLSQAYAYDFCASLDGVKDEQTYKTKIKTLIGHQNISLKYKTNRYQVARALNNCSPSENSKGLVLSFAGTGAFNPRTYDIMAKIIKCYNVRKLPTWLQKKSYDLVIQSLRDKKSNYTKWSTIEKGTMTRMIMSSKLKSKMAQYDFAIYPSEETELLASRSNLTWKNIKNLVKEIKKSKKGLPTGIKNALNCTKIYFNAMAVKGEKPKLILMSHSSGGRSVVKFLEHLKDFSDIKADLVLTIDPVKEAHHALAEVIPQLSAKYGQDVAEWILDIEIKDKKVAVWSRKQPKSLYKTSNAKRWINFYQQTDTEGLKMEPKFGIYGSPIHNADENMFLSNGLGSSAHGEIGYHADVKDKIEDELLDL